MADRETLIEKAAKAMAEYDDPGVYERGDVIADWDDYVGAARAALAVFEQAHAKPFDTSAERVKNGADSLHVEQARTPTDDEREEIARIIDGHIDVPVSSRLAIARSLQGNGFRRSKAPERQAEPTAATESEGKA